MWAPSESLETEARTLSERATLRSGEKPWFRSTPFLLQGKTCFRQSVTDFINPPGFLRAQEKHRHPPLGFQVAGQFDEVFQRPAFRRPAGSGRQPDVIRPFRQQPGGFGAKVFVEVKIQDFGGRKVPAAGQRQQVQKLPLHGFREPVALCRLFRRKQEAGGGGNEGVMRHTLQRQAGPENPLGIDNEIETLSA